MKSWLSQNSHSWSILPFFQWPTVTIPMAKRFPVGAIVLPSGVGIGLVNVPPITPVTAVHVPDPNRMYLDLDVRGKDKQGFQILDVLFNSLRLVTVRPRHDDVFSMTLVQTIPLLIAEHIEVERVEQLQILFDRGRLTFMRRRRRLRLFPWRLRVARNARQPNKRK